MTNDEGRVLSEPEYRLAVCAAGGFETRCISAADQISTGRTGNMPVFHFA
jgi:hypothetical protein